MTSRLVVLTTDGSDREDGSVYYADYVLVESDTLTFSEKIFDDPEMSHSDWFSEVENLGYKIRRFTNEPVFVTE